MDALAVDIGGTKISAAVVADSGQIVCRRQEATPRTRDPEVVFAALTGAIDEVVRARLKNASSGTPKTGASDRPSGPAGIGVATAGPMDWRAGTVSPVNIPAWQAFALQDRLADRYRLPVRMLGDAVAVVVGEHWRGAAQGRRNVLGMVISTGVGGGLILDGRVLWGTTGNAGHVGHVAVDPGGPACACGAVGCLEAVASGPAIATWAAEQGGQTAGGRVDDAVTGRVEDAVTGPGGNAVTVSPPTEPVGEDADRAGDRGAAQPVTAADLARAAHAGNPLALAAFRRAGEAIGAVVAGAVTLLDLDVVVVGGGVAGAGAVLFAPIADAYARHAGLDYAATPRVVPAALGADAGLVGAAAVVLQPAVYWQIPDW